MILEIGLDRLWSNGFYLVLGMTAGSLTYILYKDVTKKFVPKDLFETLGPKSYSLEHI